MKNIFWTVLAGFIVAFLAPSQHVSAATPQQIDAAIDKAVAFLYSQQRNNCWDGAPEYHLSATNKGGRELETGDWGGVTAMATHALLAAGENPNGPRLRPAVDLLLKWPMRMCPYALCQRDQVLQLLPSTANVRSVAYKDGDYLSKSMRTAGNAAGFYFYYPASDAPDANEMNAIKAAQNAQTAVNNAKSSKDLEHAQAALKDAVKAVQTAKEAKYAAYDHSVSQYGVLAMWACGAGLVARGAQRFIGEVYRESLASCH